MPDFYVKATGSPALVVDEWEDAPSADRPSRITIQNDMIYRRTNAVVGTVLTIEAILDGQTSAQDDSVVGLFTMWPVEYPAGSGKPVQTIPTEGKSSIQTFTLGLIGHYTIAVRHENTKDAPYAAPGGAVLIHIESVESL